MINQTAGMKKWRSLSATPLGSAGVYLLFAAVAIIAGLLATTGSPLPVGLVASLVIGAFFLARPSAAITLVVAVGLTMGALLSMAGRDFSKLSWAVSLLSFFLFIPAALHVHNLKRAPGFVHMVLAFLLFALGTTLVQWESASEVLAGIKHVFQATGLFFALALLPLSERHFSGWRKLMLFVVFLQIPFALYEFLVLVPKRGGLEAGSATTDVVAGTLGANLEGGSPNSVMALLLLIAIAFMVSHWKAGLLKARYLIVGIPLLMLPIALGEVKVVFVLLPIMLSFLFKDDLLKRPGMVVGVGVAGILLMSALGFVYVEFIMKRSLDDIIYKTLEYNVYDKGYGRYYLNRTTALVFWWRQQGLHDPVGFLVGHGIGSSFEAPGSLAYGHMAARWPGYGIGLSSAAGLLWDTGVIGLLLFGAQFPLAWHACNVLFRTVRTPFVVAEVAAIRSIVVMFAVFMVYNNSQTSLISMEIISSLILGYLAFLYREKTGRPVEQR